MPKNQMKVLRRDQGMSKNIPNTLGWGKSKPIIGFKKLI